MRLWLLLLLLLNNTEALVRGRLACADARPTRRSSRTFGATERNRNRSGGGALLYLYEQTQEGGGGHTREEK